MNRRYVVKTGIKADKPTANGNTYSKSVIESAISKAGQQIKEGKMTGGVLDRQHLRRSQDTHVVKALRLDDDELVAEIEMLDNDLAKSVDTGIMKAKPVMELPMEQKMPGRVDDILNINRIDIECEK